MWFTGDPSMDATTADLRGSEPPPAPEPKILDRLSEVTRVRKPTRLPIVMMRASLGMMQHFTGMDGENTTN